MLVAAVLVLGVALTSTVGPRLLVRLERSSVSPAGALGLWWSTILGTIGSAVAALVLLLMPDHGGVGPLARLVASCWTALTSSSLHADGIAAAVSSVVVGAALLPAGWRGVRSVVVARRHADSTMWMLEPAGQWDQGVLWLEHADPVAFSVGGRANVIVASTGLRAALGEAELRAVLAHERAHLVAAITCKSSWPTPSRRQFRGFHSSAARAARSHI